MKSAIRTRVSIAILAAALPAAALVGSGPASAAPKTVNGTVGPGFTISLKRGGKQVHHLKPATYRFKIADRSSSHNFRLKGPGYNKAITSVRFKGTKSATVKLRKGTYRYVCDVHPSMNGSFTVR